MILKFPRTSAFILGLIFPLAFAPFFIFPVALVSLPLLLYVISAATSSQNAFYLGWWYGFGFFITGLYWIANALFVDIGSFFWLLPFAVFAIPAVLAIYIGLVAVLSRYCARNSEQLAFYFIIFWVFAEIVRANFLGGYPWLIFGYAIAKWDSLVQTASIFGVYGLSIMAMVVACSPFLFFSRDKNKVALFFLVTTIIVGNVWYSTIRLNDEDTQFSTYQVRLVQGNFQQNVKSTYKEKMQNLATLQKLSEPNHEKFSYILWPEGAIDFLVDVSVNFNFPNFIPTNGFLLAGSVRVDNLQNIQRVWNSVLVVDSRGSIKDYYDKRHLVPFGEFVPFKQYLPITKVTQGTLDFSHGETPNAIRLKGMPTIFPLICYEAYFTEDAEIDNSGLGLMVNFTNDAWYGNSSGPYQHLYMSKLRAIEYGLPMLRVANTGISAVFDSYGRMLSSIALNQRGVIDSYIPLPTKERSLYSKYGSSEVIVFAIFALACFIYGVVSKYYYDKKFT